MSKTKGDLDEAHMTNQRHFSSKRVLTLWFVILVTALAVTAAPESFPSRFKPDHVESGARFCGRLQRAQS